MNAYNQENVTGTDSKPHLIGTVNRYQSQGSDNTYALLVKKYSEGVENIIVKILVQNKKMSEKDASTFCDNMFSLGDKRQADIREEVQTCYDEGKTKRQCAHQLVDKYYKITKVNKYQNKTNYQTDRDQSGEGEVTEVSESVRDMMTPKSKEQIRQVLTNIKNSDKRTVLFELKGILGSDEAFINFIEQNLDEKEINHLKKRLRSRYSIPYDMLYTLNDKQIDKIINLILKNEISENVRSLMTPLNMEESIDKFMKLSKSEMENVIYYDYSKFFQADMNVFFDFVTEIGITDLWERVTEIYPADYSDTMVVGGLEVMTKEELTKLFKSMYYGNVNEKVKYEQFKQVAPSLFWNFVERLRELDLKFKLDISYVKGLNNSLNTPNYVVYMETPKINNREVEFEFKHSKILSNILTYITGKESENEMSFYIGFDQTAQLHFGFFINDKRYKIGYTLANSYDFQKLIPYITADKDIDLMKLSRKFISNIQSLSAIKTILTLYLDKYEDDILIYNSIINNNFGIIIESLDDEVISQQYIEEIIKKYVKISHYSNWYVEKMKSNNKTFYYFILK